MALHFVLAQSLPISKRFVRSRKTPQLKNTFDPSAFGKKRIGNCNVFEANYLQGDEDAYVVVKEIWIEEHRSSNLNETVSPIPMRPDHRLVMPDDLKKRIVATVLLAG